MKISISDALRISVVQICCLGLNAIPTNAAIESFSPDHQDLQIESHLSEEAVEQIFPKSENADYSAKARLERIDRASRQFPNNATLLEKRALAYAELGDYQNAWKDINHAIACHPERHDYYWTRAQIDIELKKYQQGLDDCQFARKIAGAGTTWISSWIRAKILKAMGRSEDSIAAAQDALNSMANCGLSSDYYYRKLVQPLLQNRQFSPHRNTNGKASVIKAIKAMSERPEPPDNQQLSQILGIKSNDLQRPFNHPNDSLMVIQSNDTPWLSVRKELVGNANRYLGLELHIDSDKCSITEQDLITELGASKPKPDGGLAACGGAEEVLQKEAPNCRLNFLFQPGGFKSLGSVQISW